MRRADVTGGVITVLFGVFAVTQAAKLDYWSRFGPGPGFIPLWSSIIILSGGILLVLQGFRKKPTAARTVTNDKTRGLITVGVVIGLTMVAAVLMSYLGFAASMFLYVLVLIGGIGRHRWYVAVCSAALTAISFYVVFATWLQVPLPKGVLGF